MSVVTWRTLTGHPDPNPFVGPRPIQQGEALHGRSAEVDELCDRLEARRIVVLHSPSGAGKSSLVQAGLAPRLKRERYDVWKPIRLNLDPHGLEGVPEGTNRYLFSAMISLEEELPPEHRRSPAQLAGLDFLEYLHSRPRRKGKRGGSVVLLFDQFEEVLTVDPQAVEAKRGFSIEVGRALGDENYWALFIIREDYLAALAPYRDWIPTRLSNTFRLDLLGSTGAREAAEQLALSRGRSFPAVEQLIRDLSRVKVQRSDGTFVSEQGHHVEPVQLQVVCRRLWAAMPEDSTSIETEDLEAYGDVSTSLAGYYADAVRMIAGSNTGLERAIRHWVGHELIVAGHRSQVRQDAGGAMELGRRVIERLLDTYLVRIEQRAGANWFELSHDRLVEPILEDNEAWEQSHLHPLQVQAKLWEDAGRTRAQLLRADALPEAQEWAEQNPQLLTRGEREFLKLSQARRAEAIRRRRRERGFMVFLVAVAAVTITLGLIAFDARDEAEQKQTVAEQAKEDAEQAKVDAQRAQKDAEKSRDEAEQAHRSNERLTRQMLRQLFEVALRHFVQSLADEGLTSGEVEVDEQWTPLLEWKGKKLAAATVVEGKGRIVVAGQDAALRMVDEHGDSLFVEITTSWLLGNQARLKIAILSSRSEDRKRLAQLERSLDELEYEYEYEPPLDDIERLSAIGMLIIDDRWLDFTTTEIATVASFIRRGGGVLAVGQGWSWVRRATADGQAPPTLENYPMNRLLSEFGVRWTSGTVSPEELEKVGKKAVVRFKNHMGETVEIFSYDDETGEELYGHLPPDLILEVVTALERRWIVRAAKDGRHLREDVIADEDQTIVIRKKTAPRRGEKPTPGEKPTAIPQTLSKADMKSVLADAEKVSRGCGKRESTLFPSIKIKLQVEPSGEVSSASAPDHKGTTLGKCVANAVEKLRFPESKQGTQVTWDLPLQ